MYLPLVAANPTPAPTLPPRVYGKVRVQGGSLGWPAASSPDVNLSLRSYVTTTAYLGLVNYNGDTDAGAPQMAAIYSPARLPGFTGAYQVYDWDWNCNPPPGCRGNPLDLSLCGHAAGDWRRRRASRSPLPADHGASAVALSRWCCMRRKRG